MLKKALLALVLLVTVSFATLATPNTADAQRFRRWGGGYYGGGYYGGYSRPYYGSYYTPYYRNYYSPYYSGYYGGYYPSYYSAPVHYYGW